MSPVYPDQQALQSAFSRQPRQPFTAWSALDEVKNSYGELGNKTQKTAGRVEETFSPKYYAVCISAGSLACGLTHIAITPLDLVKCRRQVDPKLYSGNLQAWKLIYRTEGVRGLFTGWSPSLFGYSAQGAVKYGGYEFFKSFYSDVVGPEKAATWKTGVYLAASASAEFFADIALCPFEAVKVRTQTTMPPFATGTFDGIRKIVAKEGTAGLFKGLYPLWGRQIPYTMMKFASFETIVEMIYASLPGKMQDYSPIQQTAVAFTGGYLAGILCAIVSHPADVMVSKLNASRHAGEAFGAAMTRIYSQIGCAGLWTGLGVRIVMIGTLTGLQWMIYDSAKILMGLPTTGGQEESTWRFVSRRRQETEQTVQVEQIVQTEQKGMDETSI